MLHPKNLKSFVHPRRPYRYSDRYELRSENSSGIGNLLVVWNHRRDVYMLEACQLPVKAHSSDDDRMNVLVEVQKVITEKMSARHEMLLLWEVVKVAGEVRIQVRHLPTFALIQFWTPVEVLPPLRIVYEGHREELSTYFGDSFRSAMWKDGTERGSTGRHLNPLEIPLLKQKPKVRKRYSRK